MSQENIIRAWKDSDYRDSLSKAEKSLLPEHPAGLMQLSDEQLGAAAGGIPKTDSGPICFPTEVGPRCAPPPPRGCS